MRRPVSLGAATVYWSGGGRPGREALAKDMRTLVRRSFIYAGLALVSAGVVAVMTHSVPSSRRSFPAKAESRLKGFGAGGTVDNESYADLFTYLVQGFETYRSPGGASAAYPGLPSEHGRLVDGMEGFSRIAPLPGAWVRPGRPSRVAIADGKTVDLCAGFRRGLVSGTDPRSAEYWGVFVTSTSGLWKHRMLRSPCGSFASRPGGT